MTEKCPNCHEPTIDCDFDGGLFIGQKNIRYWCEDCGWEWDEEWKMEKV